MSRSPRITGAESIAGLAKDGRSTVVPVHSGDTPGSGLLHKILRDCNLTPEDLRKLL